MKNDGGQAFPTDVDRASRGVVPGMSLRDYFAASALQGMISHDDSGSLKLFACAAYEFADAMIAEREK